jgi:hypothetical protein
MIKNIVMVKLVFVFVIISSFCSCSSLLQERASWHFMQAAEFEIGLPVKNNSVYYLPFSCDLTKRNSAPLVINKSNIKINNDNDIELYLFYTLSKNNNMNKIKLGKLSAGNYRLYYVDIDKTKYLIEELNIE